MFEKPVAGGEKFEELKVTLLGVRGLKSLQDGERVYTSMHGNKPATEYIKSGDTLVAHINGREVVVSIEAQDERFGATVFGLPLTSLSKYDGAIARGFGIESLNVKVESE